MVEKYLEILTDAGGTMLFPEFVQACRAVNVDPGLWLRAKHLGKVYTWVDEQTQNHFISSSPRPVQQPA